MQNEYIREEKIIDKTELEKERELIKTIINTREELKAANKNFEYAQEELVDYYSYKIKANQAKLDYLIKIVIEDPGAAGKGIGDAIIQQQTAILMSVGLYLQKPVCQPWKTGFCIYDGKHCGDFRVRGYIGQGNAAFCIHMNLPFIKFCSLFMRQLYGLRLS